MITTMIEMFYASVGCLSRSIWSILCLTHLAYLIRVLMIFSPLIWLLTILFSDLFSHTVLSASILCLSPFICAIRHLSVKLHTVHLGQLPCGCILFGEKLKNSLT